MSSVPDRAPRAVMVLVAAAALIQLAACAPPYPPAYQAYPPQASRTPPQQPTATTYVEAPVVKATPVYRDVQVASPRQACRQVPVDNSGNHVAGALIGGALGGLVGNQFGRGSGNAAMTAAGAVAGAVAGNAVAAQGDRQVAQQCQTVNDYSTQRQQDGYDVTYRYAGQTYHTHSDVDPGSTIRVRVQVTPQ